MRFPPAPAVARSTPSGPLAALSDDSVDPLSLPAAFSPPARPPFPLVAAIVPVVGAVGLWLVTGSILSLWLAALGPLIAVATVADAARTTRRDRRRHEADSARARVDVARAVDVKHEAERRRAWARHPDVAGYVARDDEVWRRAPERADVLVAGEGEVPSALRVTGGEGDADAAALRARANRLSGAPVVVPARGGIAVVGAPVVAAAVQRALALQLCHALAPGELALTGSFDGDREWMRMLPHRSTPGTRRLAVVAAGESVPHEADIAIAHRVSGEPLPPGLSAVLHVSAPGAARLEHAGEAADVRVEALARDQAEALAESLARRGERTLGIAAGEGGPLRLAELIDQGPEEVGTLAAVIGADAASPVVLDLVDDGPHAVVAGVTGSGKSELLLTWVLALCRTRTPREVVFLLADFKGGTAFDPLREVPHVTGVITDLDGSGARRAIESLRAEIRWREAAIAGAGARDIRDPRVDLPRLVVVVDEFAALLGDQPELHAVFADVAARGRALGIHLILGTQRAAGVIRDNLLANCPLRVSLRVTDPADSRALIGTDDAALLPGGPEGRGRALVRRAGDARARSVRVALSDASDVDAASGSYAGPEPRRPWLPELPAQITLAELGARPADRGIALALADEPERQRQRTVVIELTDRALLVLGGPGSGASNTLRVLAAQAPGEARRIPSDPEGAWDAVAALAAEPPHPGDVVCIDDLDAVVSGFPPDHAQIVVERLEALLREAGGGGFLVAAAVRRLTGPIARLADLFSRRLILGFPTRGDHIAAGGDPARFRGGSAPGRGDLDGVEVQVALAPASATLESPLPTAWHPSAPISGFVSRRSPAARAALGEWSARGVRVVDVDAYAADPSVTADGPVIIAGEPDDWQRHWRLLAEVRGDHDLVIDSACAPELRLLTGIRGVPPYCEPGRGRAWLVAAGADPVRIVLPPAHIRPNRRPRDLDPLPTTP